MNPPALERLLPHRRPMLMLDRLVEGDSHFAVATLRVDERCPLVEAGLGLPAWALVEAFAQTAALIGGLKAREEGVPLEQGFLLGTRRLECRFGHVPFGTELELEACTAFVDGAGMGAYDCRTRHAAYPAECVLSVFTPGRGTRTERGKGAPDHE